MGYYRQFPAAIPRLGARSIVFLALSPLSPLAGISFDLHALAMPPAFNLSQNQTLHLKAFDAYRLLDRRYLHDSLIRLKQPRLLGAGLQQAAARALARCVGRQIRQDA